MHKRPDNALQWYTDSLSTGICVAGEFSAINSTVYNASVAFNALNIDTGIGGNTGNKFFDSLNLLLAGLTHKCSSDCKAISVLVANTTADAASITGLFAGYGNLLYTVGSQCQTLYCKLEGLMGETITPTDCPCLSLSPPTC